LANGGANSGIGASTNAPANLVIDGGTLKYTGATTSTDRQMTVGTGGATLEAAGPARSISRAPPPSRFRHQHRRTVTLSGTNTGDNTLAAQSVTTAPVRPA